MLPEAIGAPSCDSRLCGEQSCDVCRSLWFGGGWRRAFAHLAQAQVSGNMIANICLRAQRAKIHAVLCTHALVSAVFGEKFTTCAVRFEEVRAKLARNLPSPQSLHSPIHATRRVQVNRMHAPKTSPQSPHSVGLIRSIALQWPSPPHRARWAARCSRPAWRRDRPGVRYAGRET